MNTLEMLQEKLQEDIREFTEEIRIIENESLYQFFKGMKGEANRILKYIEEVRNQHQ